ncbi:hypothetical protein PybrP1_001529, partial [[Pythium] brassicae (nom. inval.)]
MTVVMLDFSKAYDSLDWTYLASALSWHGLPEPFVRVVMVLHQDRTACFLANGYESGE